MYTLETNNTFRLRGCKCGASTVKWTVYDPCLVFNESESKLYTNFDSCEEKFINILKHIDLQSQSNLWWLKNSKKSLHILDDGTSGVQASDIEQVVVQNLLK
jgi:hypothetical protein